MTIDEAIEEYRTMSTKGNIMFPKRPDIAEKTNLRYKQIAEWLEDYKNLKDLPNQYADKLYKNAYENGRKDAIDELKGKKDEIIRWLIKRDKEGYGTTNGELLDHILGIAEQMKEGAECI